MTKEEVQNIFDACACDYTAMVQIGAGSFGTVWLVKKHSLDNQLKAVKFLRRENLGEVGRRAFGRDVEGVKLYARANVTHQNLIKILDTRDTGEDFFYCMDAADDISGSQDLKCYLPDTLSSRLKNAKEGRLEFSQLCLLGTGLLEGLKALHRAGLCHRDVKPSNVLFVNALPVLTDMGCVSETSFGKYTGFTPGFVPEYGSGENYDPVDHDLYALGKLLYVCWSGCDAADFPRVPLPLLRTPEGCRLNRFLVMRACAGTRAERFADAESFSIALQEALYGTDAAAVPMGQVRRSQQALKMRLRAWRWGSALLWLAALATWAVFQFASSRARCFPDADFARAAACGNCTVAADGEGVRWKAGEGGVAIGLFAYPHLELERESVEISFSLAAEEGKFNLDICFYPMEIGAVMNPYNVMKKENFGGTCRWLTLRFRQRALEMTTVFFGDRERELQLLHTPALLTSNRQKMNRVRIVRGRGDSETMRRTSVYLDGRQVASYEEPEAPGERFAFALGAVAPECVKISELEIR